MITGIYASLLGLLFVLLSIRTIRARRRSRIALGYGEDPGLIRSARVHANFAEYVPIALLLIYFVEVSAAPMWLVHVLGIILLAGRGLHAYGVSQVKENYHFRILGMSATFTVIVTAPVSLP
jgi:uncharacterized protein